MCLPTTYDNIDEWRLSVPTVYEKAIRLLIMFGPCKEYVFVNATELNETNQSNCP